MCFVLSQHLSVLVVEIAAMTGKFSIKTVLSVILVLVLKLFIIFVTKNVES